MHVGRAQTSTMNGAQGQGVGLRLMIDHLGGFCTWHLADRMCMGILESRRRGV